MKFLRVIAAALILATPLVGNAEPILAIDIQPIQVCDDGGGNCANSALELFADIGNKIWAQADIMLNFLSWMTVNDSSILNSANHGSYTANQHLVHRGPGGLRRCREHAHLVRLRRRQQDFRDRPGLLV